MKKSRCRSYLFVPGNRPEKFDKAYASDANQVIIDLEDAVPMTEKSLAREAIARWLTPERPVLIRINSADTTWFGEDVELCRAPGVAGIVLAKAERVEDISYIGCRTGSATPILPLIESAQGFSNAAAIAGAALVRRLMFGSIDFQLDLGIDGDEDELLYFRSQLVLISRLAGIEAPVDGVCTAIDDRDRLRADTLRARRLGFGAKLCIHPRQVAAVNACFLPSAAEAAWAGRILAAAQAANGAAIAVDGKMVDRPVIAKAENILEDFREQ